MTEERMRILQMIRDHALSAEDGARLLAALSSDRVSAPQPAPAREGRWLHIRVSEPASGHMRANIRLPISLIEFGLKLGAVDSETVAELRSVLSEAQDGAILEVDEGDDGERVQIYLE